MKTKGWAKVLVFTVKNLIKSKSFLISTVLILVLMIAAIACANIIPNLVSDEENQANLSGEDNNSAGNSNNSNDFYIEKIYYSIENNIGFTPDFSGLRLVFPNTAVEQTENPFDIIEQLKVTENQMILVQISKDNYNYDLLLTKPALTDLVSDSDCSQVTGVMSSIFNTQKLNSIGVSEKDIAVATSGLNINTVVAGEKLKSTAEIVFEMIMPMGSAIILFMLIFIYGQLVAQSVAVEKTSRVMELLLTSIRPLAVIIGKVLGTGIVAFAQFILMILTGVGTFALTSNITGKPSILSQMDLSTVLAGFGPAAIVMAILSFILGFAFYATFCGLIGASVSRMEDLAQAMQPVSLIAVVGFYLAYFGSLADGVDVLDKITQYLPFSSPFILPSKLLSGEMSTGEGIVSMLILAAFVALLAIIVAKVYESIILHSGDRIKLGQIIKLARKK